MSANDPDDELGPDLERLVLERLARRPRVWVTLESALASTAWLCGRTNTAAATDRPGKNVYLSWPPRPDAVRVHATESRPA